LGQISLPRLNRVNTSMTWEASTGQQNERWMSAKTFLTYRFLALIFLRFRLQEKNTYSEDWNIHTPFQQTKGFLCKLARFTYTRHRPVISVNHYIYQNSNSLKTLIFFSTRATQIFCPKPWHSYATVLFEEK